MSTRRTPNWQKQISRFDALPGTARIGVQQLAVLLGCHRQSIWRWVRAERIPMPDTSAITGKRTWPKSVVLQLLEARR